MPFYDFSCPSCAHRFTVRQGFHDEHEAACPKCDTQSQRRFTTPAIVFKGSGFYVNDYGGRSASTSGGQESESDSSEGQGSDSSSGGDDGGVGESTHSHPHPHPH